MKRLGKYLVLMMVLIGTLALFGCGGNKAKEPAGATTAPAQEKVYTVAYVGPLTGAVADLGVRAARAIEMAVDEVNQKGGVTIAGEKYKLKYVKGDTQGNIDKAVAAITRLIEVDKVDAILGGQVSSSTLAKIEVAERLQTPMVIVGAAALTISKKIQEKGFKYVYRSSNTVAQRGDGEVGAFMDLIKPEKRIYVISEDTDYSRDLVGYYQEWAKKNYPKNPEWVIDWVETTVTDFAPNIVKIGQLKPEGIMAVLNGAQLYSFTEQKFAAGIKLPILGPTSTPASSSYVDKVGVDKAEGMLANIVWVPKVGGPDSQRFNDDFTKRFGMTPADLEVQAYDSSYMLFDALSKAKSASKADVAAALPNAEIMGVRGKNKYDPVTHNTLDLQMVIAQIQNGKHVAVWPEKAKAGEFKRYDK